MYTEEEVSAYCRYLYLNCGKWRMKEQAGQAGKDRPSRKSGRLVRYPQKGAPGHISTANNSGFLNLRCSSSSLRRVTLGRLRPHQTWIRPL